MKKALEEEDTIKIGCGFKRQTPEADKVYCLTSAARRAIGILGGTVNGVSDSHRDTVKEYDPEVYAKPIYGVTNGNRQSLTSGEFNRVFIELFGSQKKKQILKIYKSELERLKGPQGNFERVKRSGNYSSIFINGFGR